MARLPRRCWDSVAFVGWLGQEADKREACESVVRAAERGELEIVASALALAEAINVKHGHPRLSADQAGKISGFFRQPYIVVVNVDRAIAEQARQLSWDHPKLDPKDAIHVATALRANALHLDTFDGPLIALSEKLGGNPPLKIGRPDLPLQTTLLDQKGQVPQAESEAEDDDEEEDDEEE
jgi:predicted nucleic acid-binding protein